MNAAEAGMDSQQLADRCGIVMGAGQQAGETMGNGRATALALAAAGARVMCVDLDGASAGETADLIRQAGGQAFSAQADWTDASACHAVAQACLERWDRIDFLQNNVGIGIGDGHPGEVSVDAMRRMFHVNVV